jgi:hypothetical protein
VCGCVPVGDPFVFFGGAAKGPVIATTGPLVVSYLKHEALCKKTTEKVRKRQAGQVG